MKSSPHGVLGLEAKLALNAGYVQRAARVGDARGQGRSGRRPRVGRPRDGVDLAQAFLRAERRCTCGRIAPRNRGWLVHDAVAKVSDAVGFDHTGTFEIELMTLEIGEETDATSE